MTEETKVSGEEQVNEGQPVPKFTEARSDSATSAADSIAEQVAKILTPQFEKMMQSTKDKRIAKLEKAIGSLAELEEMGVQVPPEVKLEMRLRDLESRENALQTASQGSGTAEAGSWLKIIEDVGLNANAPETIQFLRGQYRNLDHVEAEAFKLKRRLDSQPQPDQSTSPTLKGQTPKEKDQAGLVVKLRELQKDPIRNQKAIAEVTRDLGW